MEKIKAAVLAAFGQSKNGDEIQKLIKCKYERNKLQDFLSQLNPILNKLEERYNLHKYQIYFVRFWLMNRMIKSTLKRAVPVLDHIENQSKGQEVEDQGNEDDLAAQVKYYSKRSSGQVADELSHLTGQIETLQEELSQKRRRLGHLRTDYQTSKNKRYFERYKDMKRMIKTAFR